MTIKTPPPRPTAPLINKESGLVSKEWMRFFLLLFTAEDAVEQLVVDQTVQINTLNSLVSSIVQSIVIINEEISLTSALVDLMDPTSVINNHINFGSNIFDKTSSFDLGSDVLADRVIYNDFGGVNNNFIRSYSDQSTTVQTTSYVDFGSIILNEGDKMNSRVSTLASVLLTGSVATLYTSPANTYTVIKSAVVANDTGGAVSLTLYKVPSGGSAGATNIVVPLENVASKETYLVTELLNKVLAPGDTIQGKGLDMALTLDGITVTQ